MTARTLTVTTPKLPSAGPGAVTLRSHGHPMVAHPASLRQGWWTQARIDATVTRAFITACLGSGADQLRLLRPVTFGDDSSVADNLTDDTYLDWIVTRARRLFAILVDLNIAPAIFSVIDSAWDDTDLPLSADQIRTLRLFNTGLLGRKDPATSVRHFFDLQFKYLLRVPQEGDFLTYDDHEFVPLEPATRSPSAGGPFAGWDAVRLPDESDRLLVHRRIRLSDLTGAAVEGSSSIPDSQGNATIGTLHETFRGDVETARQLAHPHIAPVWAAYTHLDKAGVLTNFVAEHTVRTFTEQRPPNQYLRLSPRERHLTVIGWMMGLADALVHLHQNKVAHTSIQPSNVLIDAANHIAFKDIGSLRTLQVGERKTDAAEEYNYGAPETYSPKPPTSSSSSSAQSSASSSGPSSEFGSTPSSTSTTSLAQGPVTPKTASVQLPTTTISPDGTPSYTSDEVLPAPRHDLLMAPTSLDKHASVASAISSVFSMSAFPTPPNQSPIGFSSLRSPPLPPLEPHRGSRNSVSTDISSSTITPASFHASKKSGASATLTSSPTAPKQTTEFSPRTFYDDQSSIASVPSDPATERLRADQAADIFALGAIYLDLLTFLLKRKSTEFSKYRSSKVKAPRFGRDAWLSRNLMAKTTHDASFHANLDRVTAWTDVLSADLVEMPAPRRARARTLNSSQAPTQLGQGWALASPTSASQPVEPAPKQQQQQQQPSQTEQANEKTDLRETVPALLIVIRGMLREEPEERLQAWEVADRLRMVLDGTCIGIAR